MSDETEDLSVDRIRGILESGGAPPEELERFDAVISRRRLLGLAGVGGAVAFAGLGAGPARALKGLFGRGLIPAAWAQEAEPAAPRLAADPAAGSAGREGEPQEAAIPGKPGMIIHNHRPVNGEFPPHLLDADVTPSERHFVRNHGLVPERALKKDPRGWKLTIDGEVNTPLELSLDDLGRMPAVTLPLLVECGGNGRATFDPPVRGNQWDRGAVACAAWTGVRLRDVLERAGLKPSAVYTAHYSDDPQLGAAPPFSRGIPIDKAMEPHTLIAYRMNGEDLPTLNGYPVRLVVPGWVGSCSQKWLNRIWIRDRVHDSAKMTGYAYRIPAHPPVPGVRPPESDMVIATSWPVKSLITRPASGAAIRTGSVVQVGGHAWAGDGRVDRVLLSTDYGIHWSETALTPPVNPYAWYDWRGSVRFAGPGYYEIWARAFDSEGNAQPFRQPWNPKGYLGNVIHRVPVTVI